jgi:gamma-glutamyltranspeptidase/glutathione hydrolase
MDSEPDPGDQTQPDPTQRSTLHVRHGVIATSQPLASEAGLAVLKRGGNAFDAAVTAAAVLAVVEPHMTGIGGDVFAMLWLAEEGRLVGLNASGRSGSLMTPEALHSSGHTQIPTEGAEPITVPGALSGWALLLQRYGTLSLAEALQPAIRLADEGFSVTPIIARQWADQVERLGRDDGARSTFLIDDERAPNAGETLRNPDLAASFCMIAKNGPSALYDGDLGRRIVDRVRELGGFLTLDDFKRHKPVTVEPVCVDFKGYRVWELPPNGQGIAALEMLRMLEGYDLAAMGHNTVSYIHHLIEAKKLAFADLAHWVGDPEHMAVSVDALLSDDFVRSRRRSIDPGRVAERVEPGTAVTSSETICLSAADEHGNMISFINSIFWNFGSGVVVPGTGFALQNRGAGFTLEPDRANTLAPRKRPFHTIIPAIVTVPSADGGEEPWLSFGVMGRYFQPQGHVQLLCNLLVFGMDLQEAIDAPRFSHVAGRDVALESALGNEVRSQLAAMGHVIMEDESIQFGGSQAVMRTEHGWAAGSDPRKDGVAVGY